mmetsp:Transcript_49121/g.96022  ORF Transcript_49121/g.96022 Transcript_49121/m.96022 type:complete len:197 (+) Transcript_49121:449-1039(+)
MATPDDGMPVLPAQVTNAKSLQSSTLYAMVSDTTSDGHAWLPHVMTDGRYQGDPEGGSPVTPPPIGAPAKNPIVAPTKPPVGPPVVSPTACPAGKKKGEQFCEQSGFTQAECTEKCCCAWEEDGCWFDNFSKCNEEEGCTKKEGKVKYTLLIKGEKKKFSCKSLENKPENKQKKICKKKITKKTSPFQKCPCVCNV